MDARKRSFDPVVDTRTRLLVLGSLPGERSLARAQYYAHPQNQFWRLMGGVTGIDLASLDYDARLEALLGARIGLWDVVASALRRGSLDAGIRDHQPNDLAALVQGLPDLRAVAFNGGTSARIGGAALGGCPDIAKIALPSSSPAYTLAFGHKQARWNELRRFLA